jgi:hypothetical protein
MNSNSKDREQKNKEYLDTLIPSKNDGGNNIIPPDKGNLTTAGGASKDPIDYSQINVDILPAGRFYRRGTRISIRAAKVHEIQSYSMVDDNNFVDITEKMNEILSRNVRFVHPDGTEGSFLDVHDKGIDFPRWKHINKRCSVS